MQKQDTGDSQPENRIREQLELGFYTGIEIPEESSQYLGTFQDNLQAPIHRWFKYPAGFSYKLIETLIRDKRLASDAWLLDPFVGCGTTSVVAKERGINSFGIEAHPFVWWVAKVKCFWEYDMQALRRKMLTLVSILHRAKPSDTSVLNKYPALVHKCYSPANLQWLDFIHDTILQLDCNDQERDFFLLALVDTLRTASKAGTGWPYIAPTKYHEKQERDAVEAFCNQVQVMYKDLMIVRERSQDHSHVNCYLLHMDARDLYPIESESIDLAVTSPPYLNNYDYADRTRLEMYFLGLANSWRDITEQVRDKLIVAATTQIRRSEFSKDPLSAELRDSVPLVYAELRDKIQQLAEKRLCKGGKKSYDLMVAGYFNDMLRVLKQVYRVLKKGNEFVLVLGDSAPYGVHIPTEEYLGKLGLSVGFERYLIRELRERGRKWGHNPQRHKVMLKESLLTLVK